MGNISGLKLGLTQRELDSFGRIKADLVPLRVATEGQVFENVPVQDTTRKIVIQEIEVFPGTKKANLKMSIGESDAITPKYNMTLEYSDVSIDPLFDPKVTLSVKISDSTTIHSGAKALMNSKLVGSKYGMLDFAKIKLKQKVDPNFVDQNSIDEYSENSKLQMEQIVHTLCFDSSAESLNLNQIMTIYLTQIVELSKSTENGITQSQLNVAKNILNAIENGRVTKGEVSKLFGVGR